MYRNLTAPFTVSELSIALNTSKLNRSPGCDGIPYEFYRQFWEIIAPHFLAMINEVLSNGLLLPSQGKATIRLIPKIPNPKKVTDYRPISLLNTDYKLLASAIAGRLRKTLPFALQNHQKGGVPGRFMHDSLSMYRDVIEHVSQKKKSKNGNRTTAAILAYDLEKAYDLVDRQILWKIMTAMGYPKQFIDWLKTLYSIIELCPLNGSTAVGTVNGAQSVRQGCPLSIHLFAIYIEPLLVRIARNIDGIDIHGERIKVRAYVDDLTVFVSSNADILGACQVIDEYCSWTNARVNKSKTKLLGLGDWAVDNNPRPEQELRRSNVAQVSRASIYDSDIEGSNPITGSPFSPITAANNRISWPVDWITQVTQLKLLGITFTSNISQTTKLNWQSTHQKMIGILTLNNQRNFTFHGCVLFIKQQVLSQAIHIAHVLPC